MMARLSSPGLAILLVAASLGAEEGGRSLAAQRTRTAPKMDGRLTEPGWGTAPAATVTDRSTFTDPHHYSEGIRYVLVNGVLVVDKGAHTGARPGKVLRH
jgi:hypothetical protein